MSGALIAPDLHALRIVGESYFWVVFQETCYIRPYRGLYPLPTFVYQKLASFLSLEHLNKKSNTRDDVIRRQPAHETRPDLKALNEFTAKVDGGRERKLHVTKFTSA